MWPNYRFVLFKSTVRVAPPVRASNDPQDRLRDGPHPLGPGAALMVLPKGGVEIVRVNSDLRAGL